MQLASYEHYISRNNTAQPILDFPAKWMDSLGGYSLDTHLAVRSNPTGVQVFIAFSTGLLCECLGRHSSDLWIASLLPPGMGEGLGYQAGSGYRRLFFSGLNLAAFPELRQFSSFW